MQFAMMGAAKWHRELVADFKSEAAGLSEAKVMRVARLSATDKTGLFGDKPQVLLIAPPLFLRECQRFGITICGRPLTHGCFG